MFIGYALPVLVSPYLLKLLLGIRAVLLLLELSAKKHQDSQPLKGSILEKVASYY
jgi:hypothetical protein